MIGTLLTSVNGAPNAPNTVYTPMVSFEVCDATKSKARASARVASIQVTSSLAVAEESTHGDTLGGGGT